MITRCPGPARTALPEECLLLEVYGVSVHVHRSLPTSQARMGVDGHPYLLRSTLHQLGEDTLGIRSVTCGPMACIPRMRSVSASAMTLKKPLGSPSMSALPIALRELGLLDLVALFFGLVPGQPERGDLGAAEGTRGTRFWSMGSGFSPAMCSTAMMPSCPAAWASQ